MAFVISKSGGAFGTTLKANMPPVKAGNGAITSIRLSLGKTYSAVGKRRSLFSGSCPAPKGVNRAGFKFAKASVSFDDGRTAATILNRSCKAKG